jgi:hypothetical protein
VSVFSDEKVEDGGGRLADYIDEATLVIAENLRVRKRRWITVGLCENEAEER